MSKRGSNQNNKGNIGDGKFRSQGFSGVSQRQKNHAAGRNSKDTPAQNANKAVENAKKKR